MRALAVAILLSLTADAAANGRPAATSTINFRLGNEQHIAAGMTFGLVVSDDGGQTWRWMCEDAIKYGGQYDPDYVYTASGALFATTFDGSLVNRDGCNFDSTLFGTKFISSIALGPDNAVYMGMVHPPEPTTADPGDSGIYKSTDEGMTFGPAVSPAPVNTWWSSIEVAPTAANRIYASGYRLVDATREFLLYRSDDGGASFTPMSLDGLTTTRNSTIDIVGISHLNPDHVYVRISFQNEAAIGDAIFRSTDAGASWEKIFQRPAELSFVARANGDLVVGSEDPELAVSRHPSNGDSWDALENPPHINCLVESPSGEVWACTQNFGVPGIPSDGAGIMKSTDLVTWTTMLRFQDIAGPVECAAGTLQADRCVGASTALDQWCVLRAQFGISADPTSCASLVDGPADAGPTTQEPGKGCCDNSASDAPAGLAISALVGMVLLRRRRRG
jgi:MYXO-CTERM domain-containing protein